MNIYIGRNGSVLGQYELSALLEAIDEGTIQHTDYAWHKELQNWGRVADVVPPLLPMIRDGAFPDLSTVEVI